MINISWLTSILTDELSLPKKVIEHLFDKFSQTSSQKAFEAALLKDSFCQLKGLVGSGLSFKLVSAYKNLDRTFLMVLDNAEQAAYHLNDLEQLLPSKEVLFFPASYRQAYNPEATDNANVLLRSEVLKKLSYSKKKKIIVTYPQALFEKVISLHTLKQKTLTVKTGEFVGLDFVNETLFEFGFDRVNFVTQPGEFSVRGGIIDVFSFANQHPYRIEFFDDEIESLRSFDVNTQLSISPLDQIDLLPNTSKISFTDKRKSLIESLPTHSTVVFNQLDLCLDSIEKFGTKAAKQFESLETLIQYPPEILFLNRQELLDTLAHQSTVLINNSDHFKPQERIRFKQSPQSPINKQFDRLVKILKDNHDMGFENYIFCSSEAQRKRLNEILGEMETKVHYKTEVCPLFEGFEDIEAQIACFTDHQIFERYHKYKLRSAAANKEVLTLKELTHLKIGDFVTHIDHGIGKFGGLQKIDVDGVKQEAIKLSYGEGDILYLSIHSLHKITKFNGKDGHAPKLHKLGSKAWKILKQKTKTRVKAIAFDLIKLYAKRREKIGHAFPPDSYLQLELEASFMFEDTPDQSKATAAVKADMEDERPMDRLVCGDVGFGKTEVAIRAAFKAVDDSKQVAILVPTTILAFQHYKTFSKRLEKLPVKIDYLNRFRSTKDRKRILEELQQGKIDVLIGTHQLVNKTVKFKDLGLLIVDEEQKFGVAVKEKLRDLKTNIDVLTLTATPIPRTLQFSLMAARDLSVIATPPPNRYPIESEVVRFSETLIRDAIRYELQRGGQIYFIHNRVENIQEVAGMVQRLIPDARIAIGHGQMEGNRLEKTLLAFMEGQSDILIATTIVENGLDVPNANTIFINNAQSFGLSDLHQMRGRVGRSNKKAFCYFITPPLSAMASDAQKRIKAISQFSALGAGIHIAMKDLEIRGAGDLLGGEQSGFINEIGFETYQKILEEAIGELKENEFKALFEDQDKSLEKNYIKEVQIDTDFEILFPDEYINVVSERLALYNELSDIKNEEALIQFKKNMEDRFGKIPSEGEELLNTIRLKWLASKMGLEKLIIKNKKCLGYFLSDQQSDFYQSSVFNQILIGIQKQPKKYSIKEKQTRSGLRLLLVLDHVLSIEKLMEQLNILIID
ncbi:MAG: transcription-repair coupling factor [Flavobacteriaceae bacterium]